MESGQASGQLRPKRPSLMLPVSLWPKEEEERTHLQEIHGVLYGDSPDFFRDVSNDLTLIVNLKAALRGIKLPAYATLIG
ncbi:hypothetical protein DUI87_32795 [Hirundo rustica rustica]|uniref:Uncharacterized protein n=1 Tax=Hirundo rustica rustica TaxID=333673 RepID=A0A3M0IQP7_HIRRU|nr:hypothetical protein DUI87_32795 [Hirundo rustica rustica]